MKKLIIISIILIILAIGAVNAADDNTSVQSITDNENMSTAAENIPLETEAGSNSLETAYETPLSIASEGSFNELNNIITNAKKNTEIKLSKDYTFNKKTDSKFSEGIEIGKSLTIDGQGHTIDGNNNDLFEISANKVTLKNLILKNTHITIWWDYFNVINCSFIGCSDDYYGGAIDITGENSRIINCNFMNCSAEQGGALCFWYKGGEVINCSFKDCTANINKDESVYFMENFTLVNSTFINCEWYSDEPGNVINTTVHNIIYDDSIFRNLKENEEITLKKDCCILGRLPINETNITINANGNTIIGNGIFSITGANVSIKNCNFKNMGIKCDGINCSISNCSFTGYDYPLYFYNMFSIANSSFTNGSWHCEMGGFISNVTVDNVTYDNYIFNKLKENDTITLSGNYSLFLPVPLNKDNIVVDGNGITMTKDTIFYITGNNITVKNCNFINCSQAIFSTGSNFKLANCSFMNCYGDEDGGALKLAGGNCTVIGCRFINNSVFKTAHNDYAAISGGAIYSSGNLTVMNSTFTNNSAKSIVTYRQMDYHYTEEYGTGGAIYCLGKLYLENSCFTKNSGFAVDGNAVEVINCSFTNGASVLACSDAKITNSTFEKNTAKNGGILYLDKYELANCTFKNNRDATITTDKIALDDSLKQTYIFEAKIKNKVSKTYYNSGKKVLIGFTNIKSNTVIWEWPEIYLNGKSYYDYGISKKSITLPVSTWKEGTYNVVVKYDWNYMKSKKVTFKITVQKAPTIVKAPKVVNKYKKSKYFKITLKNKATKKAAKNVVLKLKIGKKTYKVKTNTKGIGKFNTKNLKVGTYKVKITSGNSNYKVSATSQIKIKR